MAWHVCDSKYSNILIIMHGMNGIYSCNQCTVPYNIATSHAFYPALSMLEVTYATHFKQCSTPLHIINTLYPYTALYVTCMCMTEYSVMLVMHPSERGCRR